MQADGTAYPVFNSDPERYLRLRTKPGLTGRLRRRSESAALTRCFAAMEDVRSICDVPCGPGRLFPQWAALGLRVLGVDLSETFLPTAAGALGRLQLDGSVRHGDAFQLEHVLEERPDVVASVRFIYYFERARRVALLRALAGASRRYVLTQYRTRDTLKGLLNWWRVHLRRRGYDRAFPRFFSTHGEIAAEVAEAGLRLLRVAPLGQLSDRVFVLCERRTGAALSPSPSPVAWEALPQRPLHVAS